MGILLECGQGTDIERGGSRFRLIHNTFDGQNLASLDKTIILVKSIDVF